MSYNIPYLVGDTFGRDHLTGITFLRTEIEKYFGPDAVTRADEIWPVDVTLEQAMAIAWRVKKWKLTGACEIEATTNDGGGDIHAIGSAAIECDVVLQAAPDSHEATKELEIVGFAPGPPFNPLSNFGSGSINGQPLSTWSTQEPPVTPFTGVRNTGDGATGFSIATSACLYDPTTKLFSPNIQGPSSLIGNTPIGSEAFFAGAVPNRNPITVLSGVGTGSLRVPGVLHVISGIASSFDVPMQLVWRRTGQSVDTIFSGSGSLEMTLEAIEFWPYQNSLGQPVYDEDDGHQINDPFA